MSAEVWLGDAVFAPAELLKRFTQQVGDTGTGAIASFVGLARGTGADGVPVEALVLETYRDLTRASMEAIADRAAQRFAITHSCVWHRKGRILPGEAIVFVAAAAAHRRAAFEAVDFIMDALKTEAVFWKREEGPQGRRWIEPSRRDHADAQRWQSGV